jgi:ABC-type bacteriocin/lantibiotic exporter with double-glycine peptidase domain
MNEQFKQDLKAAWDGALPIFKSIAIKAGMAIVGLMWAMFLIYFLCTMFWVFVIQIVVTIAVAVVWFKYREIVSDREWEQKYNQKRRPY